MRVAAAIEAKLTEAFRPSRLKVTDESHKHIGHAGARPEGESHFHVEIVSAAFAGKSRIERQRLIHAVLAAELASDVHALATKILTPDEDVFT
ncbi:BolA family protein [Shumkonia mesophila]|uniref:BolA family protein n=1 Tax=Shumkonia mesophila TaxID=2838854 RepID=UPI002934FB51|nr:BolA family protein [Shumkonia mesophila]